MLVKCETKSNRVKGVSFHPTLSWVIAALHNGVVQLWDYRIGSLIHKFEDHEGPVRGVDFHSSQPLFASGGDDYKLKVWNYTSRKCMFTLLGHLDYIRTVQFHLTYPWVLSASDDQTVRIWNWQNRSLIAVLTGHNHYAMCAQFSFRSDLVVSGSLDQTIRLWDVSGLREKTVSSSWNSGAQGRSAEIFGATDAVCKFILEGHDRGVNWVSFHPVLPLIVSGADDRHIKLWRYNDVKAWEVDTLKGHYNNVSCVLFHPRKDIIISNSEDRTIRVWDASKRIGLHTFRRENDRFWILAADTSRNLLAVGHDSGMVVFKLERERVPIVCEGETVFMVSEGILSERNLREGLRNPSYLASTRAPVNAMCVGLRGIVFNFLNVSARNLFVLYQHDGGSYWDLVERNPDDAEAKVTRGVSSSVAFVARNRYASLEVTGTTVGIYNLKHELTKTVELPAITDKIYTVASQRLLLKSDDKIILFDIATKKTIAEILAPGGVKYVVLNQAKTKIAFLTKHNILLTDHKLNYLASFHENIRVKGATFTPQDVLIYATLSRVKYGLENGEGGILKSLCEAIYILGVVSSGSGGTSLCFVDRSGCVCDIALHTSEYMLKLCLMHGQYNRVLSILRNGQLNYNHMLSFLARHNLAHLVLNLVSDPTTRLDLSLQCGNVSDALETAKLLDLPEHYLQLGERAQQLGAFDVLEIAHQKTKSFDRLSFLYFISAQLGKLRKMLKIAVMRGDQVSRLHNTFLLGDISERVRSLVDVQQLHLAYATALGGGEDELCSQLEASGDSFKPVKDFLQSGGKKIENKIDAHRDSNPGKSDAKPMSPNFQVFLPMLPIFRPDLHQQIPLAWPRLPRKTVDETSDAKQCLEIISEKNTPLIIQAPQEDNTETIGDQILLEDDNLAWGDEPIIEDNTQHGWEDEIRLTQEFDQVSTIANPPLQIKIHTQTPAQYVAAGLFGDAISMLERNMGLINRTCLEEVMKRIYRSSYLFLKGLPETPELAFPLLRDGENWLSPKLHFVSFLNVTYLTEQLHKGLKMVNSRHFSEAQNHFQQLLLLLPFAEAQNPNQQKALLDLINTAKNYTLAMKIECLRQKLEQSDPTRALELMVYFTRCPLMRAHLFLVVKRAMTVAWSLENYVTTATFVKRLVLMDYTGIKGADADILKAQKVLAMCEKKGTDKYRLSFDPSQTIEVCGESLSHIEGKVTKCPFCGACAKIEFEDGLCHTCNLSRLGARVIGLQYYSPI